jgi:hypothetical protein
VSGEARGSVRQSARPVIELDLGILVYPPETDGEPWRAVFTENGQRKYRQGATEAKLAEKLEKVKERLQADAANMERPGADLIRHYLDPDRLPAQDRWSRKHAHTQRRLCERFAAPVIDAVTCQDIKTWHTQQIVNAGMVAPVSRCSFPRRIRLGIRTTDERTPRAAMPRAAWAFALRPAARRREGARRARWPNARAPRASSGRDIAG